MTKFETSAWTAGSCFETSAPSPNDVPLWLVGTPAATPEAIAGLGFTAADTAWLATHKFSGQARKSVMLAAPDGNLKSVVFGLGDGTAGDPSGPSELLAGALAASLPAKTYTYATPLAHAELAAIAWGLGRYSFSRYRTPSPSTSLETSAKSAQLRLDPALDAARITNTVEAVWLGRDLINTPASDMGPDEIEAAARALAARHGASITVIKGDDLLAQNFPMIHAVGRASPRAPRLVDLSWGPENGRRVTLVGKGITFDTGGLDIKPSSGMLLMKKDMGGAATALSLAHMIMGQKLPCRLRVLLAVAENSISGDAFRPGDILNSRAGTTVEIGNTDAEGRLVLADALTLADEATPDSIFVFATLTGAARSALGPDLPAFFTNDETLGASLPPLAASIGDPLWRLPLWPGYARHLDSDIADTNNVWESPFAGAITAALFLRRFVTKARRFAHFDLYGWRTAARPLGPKGGEPQTARAVMEHLRQELTS
ncbi:MAG: leucyl aminopeptidase family protein [Hyphomicrobium sp.]|nr:leucyl aminopeptidase family protein [Hyphomicrobium sp.]